MEPVTTKILAYSVRAAEITPQKFRKSNIHTQSREKNRDCRKMPMLNWDLIRTKREN